MARSGARHVRFSGSGKDCGAHVAGTGLEPCLETRPTKKSSGRQRRIITVKVIHNEHGGM